MKGLTSYDGFSSQSEEHAHAVVDGRIHHVSVSQIQTFARCNREWFMGKVLHLPGKPPSKGQEVGTAGHLRLENYFRGLGVLGPLEELGVQRGHVPAPSALTLPEHPFGAPLALGSDLTPVGLDAAGIPLEGYVDLVEMRGILTDHTVTLLDWKFKKSIAKYGIHKSEIFDPESDAGIQLIGYAEWARRQFGPHLRYVTAGHVTFQTEGARDVDRVTDTIEVDKLPALWETVTRHVLGMRAAATEREWGRVPPTLSACSKYGGCAYRNRCFDPLARLSAAIGAAAGTTPTVTGGTSMGLLSQQAAAVQPAPTFTVIVTPPDAPAPTPVAPYDPDAPPIVSTPGSRVVVEDHTAAPAPTPPAAPPTSPAEVAPRRRGRPRNPSSPATASAVPEVHTVAAPATTPTASAPPAGGEPLAVPPPAPVAAPTPTAPPPAPVAAPTPTAPPPAPVAAPAPTPAPKATPPPAGPVTLYFNCAPMKQAAYSLAEFTRRVELDFMEKAQVSLVDLRAATSSDLGFGKWKSYLAAAAAGRVGELPCGAYIVAETDERIQCVAEALAALPGIAVVRGLR